VPEEQNPTTAPAATEQVQPPATPAPAPNPDAPKSEELAAARAEADRAWKAYRGLQTTVNRLHQTIEERTGARQAAQLQSQTEALDLLVRQNLGPEQAAQLQERQRFATERAAALQAAQSLESNQYAMVALTDKLMASAGLTEQDRQTIYAQTRNAGGMQEWTDNVHALAQQRLEEINAQRVSKLEGELKGKALTEAKAEADAQLAAQRKELGIDKVDTSTGGTASTTKSVAEMNDAEFAKYSEQQANQRRERLMRRMSGSSR
jgi:hypothetical protein